MRHITATGSIHTLDEALPFVNPSSHVNSHKPPAKNHQPPENNHDLNPFMRKHDSGPEDPLARHERCCIYPMASPTTDAPPSLGASSRGRKLIESLTRGEGDRFDAG